jgi:hypothetical protein
MQRIQFFSLSRPPDSTRPSLKFLEEVTGFDLPTTADGIWEVFSLVTGLTPSEDHLYYMSDLTTLPNAPSPAQDSNGSNEPETGWHEEGVYSVFFEDIEVLIDRTMLKDLEIRIWRNGQREDYPHALLRCTLDEFAF